MCKMLWIDISATFVYRKKKNSFEIVLTVIRVVKVTAMGIKATYTYDFVVKHSRKNTRFQRINRAGSNGFKNNYANQLNSKDNQGRTGWIRKGVRERLSYFDNRG
jgi:hypothetical protein